MKEKRYPALCGGTFFSLLLTSVKQRLAARERDFGKSDGLSHVDLLTELAKIVVGKFEQQIKLTTRKKNVSNYRQCKDNGGVFMAPITWPQSIEKFNEVITNNYQKPLFDMSALVMRFIDEDKAEQLVKALLETIGNDKATKGKTFILDGEKVDRDNLVSIEKVSIDSFLLALWHYIVNQVPDNTVGDLTFSKWHKKRGETNSTWEFDYSANVGGSIKCNIKIKFPESGSIKINARVGEPSVMEEKSQLSFEKYLSNLKSKYHGLRTLLYDNYQVPFYDFYVCNDISEVGLGASINVLQNLGNFQIITGTGGIGKSMLMRHLLLSAIEQFETKNVLPVLMPLKDYTDTSDTLMEKLMRIINNLDSRITTEQFEAKLKGGECMLLFDGWDEVRNTERRRLELDIREMADQYNQSYFFISSRPSDKFLSFERFQLVQLLPFTKQQALQLIDKLDFRLDEPKIKQNFRRELETRLFDTHKEFTENPLLLTIMLMTYEQYSEIPSKMHIFYRESFEALARRHDANKGYTRVFKTGLSKDDFIKYFSELCFRSYMNEEFSFSEESLYVLCGKLRLGDIKTEDFIYDISHNLCLLLHEGRKYHFTHRSFQEYFTAVFIKELDERHTKKLGDIFEQRYDNSKGVNVLAMLYEMKPLFLEKYVFIPFLEAMIAQHDGNYSYWTFLSDMYSGFYYTNGEVSDEWENEPNSNLYSFIRSKMDIKYSRGFDYLPPCENFYDEAYFAVETEKHGRVIYPENDIRNMQADDEGYLLIRHPRESESSCSVTKEPTEIGVSYFVQTVELLEDADSYSELINALNDDKFILKAEYNAIFKYLEDMKKRQRESEDIYDGLLS